MTALRLLIAASLLGSLPAHAGPEEDVVARVNFYRRRSGLGPVTMDPALSKGCMEHAEYLKRNQGSPSTAGLDAHKQNPKLPGATKAGAECGADADLYEGVANIASAVDGWMAGIYHRRPILDPTLTTIGLGYAKLPDGNYVVALRLPAGNAETGRWPVWHPGNKMKNVPLAFGMEIPNPLPNDAQHGGFPVTLQFPSDEVENVTASLKTGGTSVPIHLSTPEKPATDFPQYGLVALIPQQTLAPNTTYTARVAATWRGKRRQWTWSFTTVALVEVDAGSSAAIAAAVGKASKLTGTVSHGGMMDAETAFLALVGDSDDTVVSIIVPVDVWKTLGGGKKPETFKGRAVTFEGTPERVDAKFINVNISDAAQVVFR